MCQVAQFIDGPDVSVIIKIVYAHHWPGRLCSVHCGGGGGIPTPGRVIGRINKEGKAKVVAAG